MDVKTITITMTMMRRKTMAIAMTMTALLSFVSCTKDLGTYDYTKLNAITIDSIEAQQVSVFDVLHLEAGIKQSQYADNSNIDYTWYYYRTPQSTEADTIAHTQVLDYTVVMEPGDYQFYVTATDRNTGLWQKRGFRVKVTGQFAGGLLMLGNAPDDSMDGSRGLLTMGFISFNTANRGKAVTIYNTETGKAIGRNPKMLSKSPNEILVLCDDEEGGSALVAGTLTRSRSFSEMFMFKPERMAAQLHTMVSNPFGASNGFTELAIVDGNVHYRKPKGQTFSPPLSGAHGFAPYVYMIRNNVLLYDNQDGCFMRRDFGFFGDANTLDAFPEPEEQFNAFDPNKLGLKCVTMSVGKATGVDYAPSLCGIFRDNAGSYYALHMGVDYTFADGLLAMPQSLTKVSEATLPGITTATAFGSYDTNCSILYYATGDKIYMYDYNTKLPATLFLDLQSIGMGGQHVTCFKGNTQEMGDMVTHTGNDLYIAVNDEASGDVNSASIIHVTLRSDNSGKAQDVADIWKNVSAPIVSMMLQ